MANNRYMGKKIVLGYVVFCVIFFVALLAIIAIRAITTWDRNLAQSTKSFQVLRNDVYSHYLSADYIDSEFFLQQTRNRFENEPRLVLLSLYSEKDGIFYLNTKNRAFAAGVMEAPLAGRPEYRNLPLGSKTLTLPFAGVEGFFMDGVYVLIGKRDIFPIVKDTFIMLFIFLITTLIVVLLLPREAAEAPSTRPSAPPSMRRPEIASRSPTKRKSFRGADAADLLPEIDSKNLFSPETGLGWKNHLTQRLKFEIDRAASFDQDLVLALIFLENFSERRDRRTLYAQIAKLLLEDFTFQDLIFEYAAGAYALILPDTDVDQGVESLRNFQRRIAANKQIAPTVHLAVGLSARNGRLVSGATLLSEASKALERAQGESPDSIIAFKADPEKYRQLIGQRD
jgi:GGDEF domain-containing protein